MSIESSAINLYLLDGLRLSVDGALLELRLARKEQWLLAYLALRAGRTVSRSEVAELFWPDCEPARALFYLRRSLTQMRDSLGSVSWLVGTAAPRLIYFAAPTYTVDALHFDTLCTSREPEDLRRAIDIYVGPLIPGCDQEWAEIERRAREVAYMSALRTLTDQAVARRDWPDAERLCRRQISIDMMGESAYRLLMLSLAENGNAAAAMQVYRDLRLVLREEINAEPDRETAALYDAIRAKAKEPVTSAQSRSAGRIASCQPHELRPVSVPEPLSRIIGRTQEVVELCGLLEHCRLLTLIGSGGVGKTRLAIEIARRSRKRYNDGVVFAELANCTDERFVPDGVARALGILVNPQAATIDAILVHVANLNQIIVLDNCEHMLPAAAKLASSILAAGPGVTIICTSRQSLGVAGELLWRVPSLPFPPLPLTSNAALAHQKEDDALDYPSVQLFMERVNQVRADFRLSHGHPALIAEICRRLDGIPLAIELAAFRARSLPLTTIAAGLANRFQLLGTGASTAIPRQRTLKALIDWSYNLLEPDERSLFARLSVFQGGWDLDAVRAVCADDTPGFGKTIEPLSPTALSCSEWEMLDLLTSLVDKSLVAYDPSDGGGRYHMLETIREFGRDQLHIAGKSGEMCLRHALYFGHVATRTEPELLGPEQQATLDNLERDHDNMRTAISHTSTRDGALASLHICAWLWRFWMQRGYWREGRQHLRSALAATDSLDLSSIETQDDRIRANNGAGVLAYRMGDFVGSSEMLNRSIELSKLAGNVRGEMAATSNLGHVYAELGRFDEARHCYDTTLEYYRSVGNQSGVAYSLIAVGNVGFSTHGWQFAADKYEEAMSVFVQIGDAGGELLCAGNLGQMFLVAGDSESATQYAEKALSLSRVLNKPESEAMYLPVLAKAAAMRGDKSGSREFYRLALAIAHRIGDNRQILSLLETFAGILCDVGEIERSALLGGAVDSALDNAGMLATSERRLHLSTTMEPSRNAIGPERFETLWQRGRTLDINEEVLRLIEPLPIGERS